MEAPCACVCLVDEVEFRHGGARESGLGEGGGEEWDEDKEQKRPVLSVPVSLTAMMPPTNQCVLCAPAYCFGYLVQTTRI